VKVAPGKVVFRTGAQESTLDLGDVALINLFRRKGSIRHVQIRLRNGRGIRLEGYQDLELMVERLADQVPAAHMVERRI
jgi:hypothetical protein